VIAKLKSSAARILASSPLRPSLAVVLGSGFGALSHALDSAVEVPYNRLPGFLPSRIEGHDGQLLIGYLAGVPVLLLCGRSHYYEGHSMAAITFPIRVLDECGIRTVLLTNAAGGINRQYRPGDFMCVSDHINFMGASPLRGCKPGKQQAPFVDLGQAYDPQLGKLLAKAARLAGVRLHFGVYLAVSGPAYETPAEIRAFARLGADAIGMSTVPEAIVARQCGLGVVGLSCITNRAAGLNTKPIGHAEVLAVGERVQSEAAALLRRFVQLVPARVE
jgi:purine-nucleoside phosphorylase